jgi:Domain of unknown function (DUF4365)
MTKTITRQQIAGSQGEAFVREPAHDMGFLFNPYGQPEAGIDGLLELRNSVTGEVKGQLVGAQLKTRDEGAYTAETDTAFEYLLDPRDVEYWRQSNLPVIIVLVQKRRCRPLARVRGGFISTKRKTVSTRARAMPSPIYVFRREMGRLVSPTPRR